MVQASTTCRPSVDQSHTKWKPNVDQENAKRIQAQINRRQVKTKRRPSGRPTGLAPGLHIVSTWPELSQHLVYSFCQHQPYHRRRHHRRPHHNNRQHEQSMAPAMRAVQNTETRRPQRNLGGVLYGKTTTRPLLSKRLKVVMLNMYNGAQTKRRPSVDQE